MRMWLLLGIVLAIYPLTILIEHLLEKRRRRTGYRDLLKEWSATPEIERKRLIDLWLEKNPRCGAAWFLLGVLDLRSGRTRHAARAFGMAHHCDVRIESAALLTFTCLKANEGCSQDFTEQATRTWIEMKRPLIGESWEEKSIFQIVETSYQLEQSPPTRLSQLIYSSSRSNTVQPTVAQFVG